MSLSRRRFVGFGSGLLSGFALAVPWTNAAARPWDQVGGRSEREQIHTIFAYGVASGDPLADRVIIWTHVTSDRTSETVEWQIALDSAFALVVSEGVTSAEIDRDHTVKVDAPVPTAGTTYYYRFRALSCWSMIGRTRSATQDADHIRLAVVSCSSIWSGYMNAYEMIARRGDLDLVVHCGDYIYDYPDRNELRNMPFAPEDSARLTDLAAHRRRYRLYRKDPYLRRAHQQHPWSIVWDNHDIWTDATRDEAMQAFHEWTPIRSPRPENSSYIYRSLDFGPLLRVVLLDTRHIGRDNAAVIAGTDDPSILGDEQFSWVNERLQSSTSQWNILVNQVLMAPLSLLKIPLIKKSWSSFAADRDRLLARLGASPSSGNIVVTGDLHISFTAHLESEGQAVGVEFLPTSVTRGNLDETLGGFIAKWGSKVAVPLIKKQNPHIQHFEGIHHGYGLVDLKAEGATLEMWYLAHQEQSLTEVMGYAAYVPRGANAIRETRTEATAPSARWSMPAPQEKKLFWKGVECGGLEGSSFDAEEHLSLTSRLTTIRIYGSSRVSGIEWIYSDGRLLSAGTLVGSSQSYSLQDGEYFRSLNLGLTIAEGEVQIAYLEITSDQGGLLIGGQKTLQTISLEAAAGEHIIGFYGRAGKGLNKLGPVYSVNFD